MEYRGQGNIQHYGTDGVDQVSIYSGSGSVWGYGGNDSFWGSRSLLYFYGGDGNDNLSAEYSSCFFEGGDGNDIFYMGYSSVVASGGTGHDSFTVSSSSGTVHGDEGDDHIMAYQGDMVLYGDDGNDTIEVVGAAATIYGGNGNDRMIAGSHGGLLAGGAGNDTYVIEYIGTICAEAEDEGFDTIRTGASSFTLTWANIESVVATSNSGQTLIATVGSICLTGAGGNDVLTSGDGNDVLDGQGGNDTMTGGRGDDVYYVDSAQDVCVEDRGEGYDQVRTSLLNYTLRSANVEVLMGMATRGQQLTTAIADVTIVGGIGADSLYGTHGNETLVGGGGVDYMFGGTGSDIYVVDDQRDICAEAFNGGEIDTIQTDLAVYNMQWANIERLVGTSATGQNLTATVRAMEIVGGAGNDTLIAGAYNDVLNGGAGDDVMVGGAGNDIYIVDSQGDICADAPGGGTDEIRTSLDVFNVVVANIERLVGTSQYGQALATDIGDQTIIGNIGNDILNAGRGNDTLIGGFGDDWLIGGQGSDLFLYQMPEGGGDRILDFQVGVDRIALTGSAFGWMGTGALAANRFSVGEATGGQGQIVFMPGTGDVYWDANGAGYDGLSWLARLDNVSSLTAASFVVV